jgi:hypothetical protein
MGNGNSFTTRSFIVAFATLLLSFLLFFYNSGEFGYSLMAALITAALAWGTYILIHWLILALKQ